MTAIFFQTMDVRMNNPTRPLAGILLRTDDRTVVHDDVLQAPYCAVC